MREILDRIHKRPEICVWELTYRCNLRCLHCASSLNETGAARGPELRLDEALRACRELADLGCRKVVLSGGEALLHPDWEAVALQVVGLGMHASLISNGLLIDAETAGRVANAGICRVAISIDGLAPTHDAIRQNPGSFARAVAAIRHLTTAGLPVNVVTHLNRRNLPELDRLERELVAEPVEIWRLQLGAPLGRLRRHPDLVLEPADLPGVVEAVVAARRRGAIRISVGDNIGYFSAHEPELRCHPGGGGYTGALPFWCGCAAGCLSVGIEADGTVKGCLSLQSDEFIEGNLRHETLHEIWHRPGAFAYTREFTPERLAGSCRGCEYGEICRGGCTFMAFAATGRPHDNPYCLHRVLSDHWTRQKVPSPTVSGARGP